MKVFIQSITFLVLLLVGTLHCLSAQSKANDIPVGELPANVKSVLDDYIKVLNAESLEQCAADFVKIAGGSLVNPAGNALRSSVKPYSLKKDHDNVKFYKQPVVITRINKSPTNGHGYGDSAIKGDVYKIWISKKDGAGGMPAPISIMLPQGHPVIKTPKVVGIGSL